MDRGRIIDNAQNTNAVYIDNFRCQGKTSIKTINPPGGKSHFSLGWDDLTSQQEFKNKDEKIFNQNQTNHCNQQIYNNKFNQNQINQNNQFNHNNYEKVHTSVRINNNPGGKSQIIFGDDNIEMDYYRK